MEQELARVSHARAHRATRPLQASPSHGLSIHNRPHPKTLSPWLRASVLRLRNRGVIENLDVFVSIAPGADGAPRPTSALRQIYLRHNAIGDLESAEDELRQHPALELLALSHNNISIDRGRGLVGAAIVARA